VVRFDEIDFQSLGRLWKSEGNLFDSRPTGVPSVQCGLRDL
jgi:hypothetical protein